MSKQVEVVELPKCDFCATQALYDANVGMGWANVCQQHFNQFGCKLGTGLGQRLIKKEANKNES